MLPYARPYRWQIALLLATTVLDACIAAASPLVLKLIIDRGIARENLALVVGLSLGLAGLALVAAVASFVQNRASGRVGEGIVYELRTAVFAHVQHQPLAFFTRVQTGKLISRLNADVMGARQALTILLSQALSALLTLLLGLAAMFYVSWQITLAALAMIPLFLIPGRKIGHRLQRLSRAVMEQDAEMSSMMTERFNVAGALLAKLYGRVPEERELFAAKAGRAARRGRHGRDLGAVPADNRHAAHLLHDGPGVRPRRRAGHRRRARGREPGRHGGAAAPVVRPHQPALQHAVVRHDGPGELRPRLRGARPPAARGGTAGRACPAGLRARR
ncbi:ABC transporter transmembrane domain-containing protein [Actinomadura madurae]|nr:ABC transporter transmembrane domain-containing protein [Actinomadura madurae]